MQDNTRNCAQVCVIEFGTQLFDQFQSLVKLSSFFHHIQSFLCLFVPLFSTFCVFDHAVHGKIGEQKTRKKRTEMKRVKRNEIETIFVFVVIADDVFLFISTCG